MQLTPKDPLYFWLPMLFLLLIAGCVGGDLWLERLDRATPPQAAQLEYAALLAELYREKHDRWPNDWSELIEFRELPSHLGRLELERFDWIRNGEGPPVLVYWGEDRVPGGNRRNDRDVICRDLVDSAERE